MAEHQGTRTGAPYGTTGFKQGREPLKNRAPGEEKRDFRTYLWCMAVKAS